MRSRTFGSRLSVLALALAFAAVVAACAADPRPDAAAPADADPDASALDHAGTQAADPAEPDQDTAPVSVSAESFFEDFEDQASMNRFDIGLFHRDDSVIATTTWAGDHAFIDDSDACTPPDQTHEIHRGERGGGFNDDWIYRCAPAGDAEKAHIMTSIGDTSGYSLGAFSPATAFTGVREVRWDVNQTDLGDRQWTEVAVIPADRFDFDDLPCSLDVPCDTTTHDVLGSVGTQWGGQRARRINTFDQPNGYTQANGGLGYRCDECPYAPSVRYGEGYGAGDPALTSVAIRRSNYFRDNGDGTLTWGLVLEDGTTDELTVPGAFPAGPVRVVFKDHNYTPLKSPATLLDVTTFTWHWDNIEVVVADQPAPA